MPIHHSFIRNQKIIIGLKDNTEVIDKYIESKGHYLITENNKLLWKDIAFTSIYKERNNK